MLHSTPKIVQFSHLNKTASPWRKAGLSVVDTAQQPHVARLDDANFFESILFDVQPVAILHEETLSDLVGEENASVIMASWTKNALSGCPHRF